MTTPYDTILLTGAAGALGTELRRGLAPLCKTLRVADRNQIVDVRPNEEAVIFDLADEAATIAATEGVDAIVHMGGAPLEMPWQEILDSSIRGSYHIYEGARKHGVKRIAYASSVHAIGFHRLSDHIGADTPVRPDTLYGVSKCFVEALSSLYYDKFGIETACVRIFSSFPEPADRRHLWSWLSHADCVRLFSAALTAPHVGHTIAFGMSDNKVKPVDNTGAGHIGFTPKDSSEPYRAALEARTPAADPAARSTRCYGGAFVDFPHPDDDAA